MYWGDPMMMGGQAVVPQPAQMSPEAKARIEEGKAKMRRARLVWDSLRDEVTFDQWIRMGDEALCERAVNKAWDLFVEELSQLAPEPETWTATFSLDDWYGIPVLDRALLVRRGATVTMAGDTATVTGPGTLPHWLPDPVPA